ncbi:NifB/NifX family molybdenum-iron cluster-binding protein [Williamwhitmania taraxaci]|uniref:Predicted Fe-Mo cluster-binding protein, NifX family n=1 Tax=Williamwhitmania taraxaci TaxID=1640674 RepID=A0A1G6HFU7_9BACT|nr:NifB/NifX family molybdenum-iron cluster-binding protein [Williamwhitmania taraxaci]SDB92988.1 Predicted Fe-Mo cluster-binding protein, NifX family [Williamwhitmania taraxaci]
MKVAFTATGTTWESMIDARFGRTEFIVIYDEETQALASVDNSAIKDEAHGAGTATAQKLYDIKPNVLITGNGPGENAAQALKQLNMKIFINAQNMTVKEAYEHYKKGELKEI